ncbi:protein of unknown function [Candidatus Nitrosacidococcus tergens]|uniref:Uncharacterized protein n=1 Tax=Candidatus Nitrosacidococcus tergens TaxID=553981 RepID=A0A7G1QBL0_9GAMM|nr:protein of unknown function [Candidatus Nitrosacidococcus tergens]
MTCAFTMLGALLSTRSKRVAQLAQVIPWIGKVKILFSLSIPALSSLSKDSLIVLVTTLTIYECSLIDIEIPLNTYHPTTLISKGSLNFL